MENTVSIPKFLHEIHGEKSNWLDIITTHGVALLTVLASLYLANALNPPLKLFLTLFLLKLPLSFSVRWYRLKKFES